MTDKRGLLCAFGAYFIWGLFPIYWKLIQQVPAVQLLGHRIVWSFLLLALLLGATRRLPELRGPLSAQTLRTYGTAALLIGFNWFVYVWSVNAGFIVEASLGYFINPLLSVALGVVFFKERLRVLQWVPIGMAAAGVLYLTFVYGRLPWIALCLAVSFSLYGFVKKTAPLASALGLTIETGMLFVPAAVFLAYEDWMGRGAFLHTGLGPGLLMAGAGVVTTVPLLMFASAARRIPLSTIGVMQYVSPTLQFLCGVLIYGEAFSAAQARGFAAIWLGLIVFYLEALLSR